MSGKTSTEADLLIIGAGIIGSAIAYYFKKENPEKKVLIFDQSSACSGNTVLAAALMSRVRMDSRIIPLSLETYRVIPELNEITGDTIPVKYNGAVHIAVNQEEVKKLERLMNICTIYGIEWTYIDQKKCTGLVPWLNARSANLIAYVEREAVSDPYLLGTAFFRAARKLGVTFLGNTKIQNIIVRDNQVTGVETSDYTCHAAKTVLAAGVWSVPIADKAGIGLPMTPVRSHYWITENYESLFYPDSPMVIIPEANFYSRPFGNSLLFGIRELKSIYLDPRLLPDSITDYDFNFDDGWSDLEQGFPKILTFFPNSENIGIKKYIAGYSGYTPDNNFILGEVPGKFGLLLATGLSGAGISVAGGIGLGISRLASDKENPFDFTPHMLNRFGIIDPFSEEHMEKCALARSLKTSG